MRSFIRSGLICTILAPMTWVTPVAGQSVTEPGTWTVTPFVSASFGVSDGLDNSLGLGVGVGYDLTANLGFEGEIGYVFDVVGDNSAVDWSLTNFSANAIYHFDVARVTPYATFGLGIERSHVSTDDRADDLEILLIPSSTEVAYNFGGGVKYRLRDDILVRGDLRRFQANDLAPDHWRLYGGITFRWRRGNP